MFLRNGEATWLVQCKHWKSKVGAKVIRELYGLMHHHRADRVVMVCLDGFTSKAFEFALNKSIDLVDGKQLACMLSVSTEIHSQEKESGKHLGFFSVRDLADQQRYETDTVSEWLRTVDIKVNPQAYTVKMDIYNVYKEHVMNRGKHELADNKFWKRMKEHYRDQGLDTDGIQKTKPGTKLRPYCVNLVLDGVQPLVWVAANAAIQVPSPSSPSDADQAPNIEQGEIVVRLSEIPKMDFTAMFPGVSE